MRKPDAKSRREKAPESGLVLLPGIIVLLVISEAINANYKPELGLMKKDDERERITTR